MNTKMEKLITEEMQIEYETYCEETHHRPYTFSEWLVLVKGRHSQHPHERIRRA